MRAQHDGTAGRLREPPQGPSSGADRFSSRRVRYSATPPVNGPSSRFRSLAAGCRRARGGRPSDGALESGISGVRIDWAADQVVPTLGLLGGIVVVISAESMPLATSRVLLIAAAAATATLLWWVGVDER